MVPVLGGEDERRGRVRLPRLVAIIPSTFKIFDFYPVGLLDPVPGPQWTLYSSTDHEQDLVETFMVKIEYLKGRWNHCLVDIHIRVLEEELGESRPTLSGREEEQLIFGE